MKATACRFQARSTELDLLLSLDKRTSVPSLCVVRASTEGCSASLSLGVSTGQDVAGLGIDDSSPTHLMLHRFNRRDLLETLKGRLKPRETQEPATAGAAVQEAGMSCAVLVLPLDHLHSTAVRSGHTGHSSGCF